MTNKLYGTLYVGVTNNIARRVIEHQAGTVSGFTQHYNLKKLVYVEEHATMHQAIQREKNIKDWKRMWKIDLIESLNPGWNDLAQQWGFVDG